MNKETKKLLANLMQAVQNARIDCILNQETHGKNLESWLYEIGENLNDYIRQNRTEEKNNA